MKSIFQAKEHANILEYHLQRSESGMTKDSSEQLGQQNMEADDMIYTHMENPTTSKQTPEIQLKKNLTENVSVIVESQQQNNLMILNDKSSTCKNNIPRTQSLRTLVVDSTFDVRTYSNYSKEQLQEMSKRLWLPTRTDCVDLGSSCISGYSSNSTRNSLFSTRIFTSPQKASFAGMSYPLSTSTHVRLMDDESINKTSFFRATQKTKGKITRKVNLQNTKCCDYVIVTGNAGKLCPNIASDNVDYCEYHLNMEQEEYNILKPTCKWRIVKGGDNTYNRKGARCGKVCDDTEYCSLHKKSIIDPNETLTRSFKCRLLLTNKQKRIMSPHFGAPRKTFNLCVDHKSKDKETLRVDIINKTGFQNKYPYLENTPKDIRYAALKEYITAEKNAVNSYNQAIYSRYMYCTRSIYYKYIHPRFTIEQKQTVSRITKYIYSLVTETENDDKNISELSNFIDFINEHKDIILDLVKTMYDRKPPIVPIIKHRSKKDDQCITIAKTAAKFTTNGIQIHPRLLGCGKIKIMKRHLKKNKLLKKYKSQIINHDIKIQKTKTNKYYLIIPYNTKQKEKEKKKHVISCDPGVRTFITGYDPAGVVYKFCDNNTANNKTCTISNMHTQIFRVNKLIKVAKSKHKINKLQTKRLLLNEKLTNKITDMHYKVIQSLLQYDNIILPHFNTKQMLRSKQLDHKTKRIMQSQSHFLFKQRLLNRAEIEGCKVRLCSERGTTKMCSTCHTPHKVFKAETYVCSKCHTVIDRDMNASVNILLLNMLY